MLRQHARVEVGGSTGPERDDDLHRPVRIVLGARPGPRQARDQDNRQSAKQADHGVSQSLFLSATEHEGTFRLTDSLSVIIAWLVPRHCKRAKQSSAEAPHWIASSLPRNDEGFSYSCNPVSGMLARNSACASA